MGDLVFKLRGGIWTALYVIIFIMASPTWESFFYGIDFVLVGQLFRFWAAGCVGRYRGEAVAAHRLATTGAYSLMRNPLYFANGLIGIGWGIMAGRNALLFFAAAYIIVYVLIIIPREEDFLRGRFGVEYAAYCRKTGMFYPKSFPDIVCKNYDFNVLWFSERHSLWMTILGTALLAVKICI